MEKQVRHVEWASLRIAGKPLITGIAAGKTPLLWVACRASFGLVHVYCDSQLQVIWRFPSDPIFIHLEKSGYRWIERECMADSDANAPSLLVVTFDGYVWFLPVCSDEKATERPFKRKKDSYPSESKNVVSGSRKDEWGLFEDIDIYEIMDFDGSLPVSGDKNNSSNILQLDKPKAFNNASSAKEMNTSESDKVCLQIKRLTVSFSEKVIQKTGPQLVMQENMIGCVQGACFACFGRQDMVIVISTWGMELFQASSTTGKSSMIFKRLKSINGDISFLSHPTCALVVTSINNVSGGDREVTVLLHDKLFDAFSDGLSSGKPPNLLLKGDVDGCVYLSPVFFPDIDISSSRILCNLGQPIMAIVAISSGNAETRSEVIMSGKLKRITDRQHLEVRDTLLVIGQYGHIVAVSCSNKLESNSCIISSSCIKYKTSFEINLDRSNFEIREWKVQAPLTSVCVLGSQYLCYCARSEGFISLLFEDRDIKKSFGMVSQDTLSQDAKHGIGVKHQTSTQSNTSSSEQARCNLRENLYPKKLPVADAVIGVGGKDFSASYVSGRPLVLLTARGRILGIEISNTVPILEGCYAGPMPKRSWRTWESNMDEHIKRLISIVDDISRASDHIHQCNHSLNQAINELAISLKVASSILTDPNRDSLLSPNPVNRKCVRNTGFSPNCSIKITPHSAVLASSKTLAFEEYPGGSEIDCVEKLLQKEICGLARISVTLYNSTVQPLSSHWILVLELQNTGMENNRAATYSNIINNGFSLAPDSECIIEFEVKVPGLHAGPVSVFTYLCHLHDYHELLHKQYSPDDEKTNARRKHLKGLTCVEDSKIDEFFAKLALEEVTSTARSMPLDAFGSVCIPLSQHRIDILSLVNHPPQKFHLSVRASHLSNKSAGLNAHDSIGKFCDDSVLGAFSGILKFTFKESEKGSRTTADALNIWRKLLFEDFLEKGSLSKTKDKIVLSTPGGQIISMSLKGLKDQQIELYFEAPTLQLGCLLRDALIWRLKNCDAIDCFQNEKTNGNSLPVVQDPANKTAVHTKVLETKNEIEVILHKAEALSIIWNEIKLQHTSDAKEILPMLADVHLIINDLLKLYRSFRQS